MDDIKVKHNCVSSLTGVKIFGVTGTLSSLTGISSSTVEIPTLTYNKTYTQTLSSVPKMFIVWNADSGLCVVIDHRTLEYATNMPANIWIDSTDTVLSDDYTGTFALNTGYCFRGSGQASARHSTITFTVCPVTTYKISTHSTAYANIMYVL